MKTILLKFAGPLQSWGTNSHFNNRHTDFYPSKSGIIGIIAASLGYKRDEDDKIQKLNEIDFAVRVDQIGNLLKDYHIARKYKNNGKFERTYETNRYYLEDAVFVVGISHKDDDFMNKIENGLRYPYFQTFMGRRSLPICADFIIKITTEDLIESLKKCDWQAMEWYKKKFKLFKNNNGIKQQATESENQKNTVNLEIYTDIIDSMEMKNYKLRKDRVISFFQKERKFGYRYESRINVGISNNTTEDNDEHDVWSSIGD